MKKYIFITFYFLLLMNVDNGFSQEEYKDDLSWGTLSSIPDPVGFAGSFVGLSNNALIIAGGANFPDGGMPWDGAKKRWSSAIFALDRPRGEWRKVGSLPYSLGYGGSVTWNNHLIIIGGSNEDGHLSKVSSLNYEKGKIRIEELPALPFSIGNTAAVLCGDVVYVAGGTRNPNSETAEKNFWAMDLSSADRRWKVLPAWPGPSRMLNILGSDNGSIYLFSGVELVGGMRKYLKDAYRYSENSGWKQLTDLPESVAAAPAPAVNLSGKLLVFGGDNGSIATESLSLKGKHPGFSDRILSYDIVNDAWLRGGTIPTDKKADAIVNPNGSLWAPVTTTLTLWNGKIVIPGGEVRPATRTPNVRFATPAQK